MLGHESLKIDMTVNSANLQVGGEFVIPCGMAFKHRQSEIEMILCPVHFRVHCVPLSSALKCECHSQRSNLVINPTGKHNRLRQVITKPQGTTTAGCPVRLVTSKLALPGAGETKQSHCAISFSISCISRVRARCARRYSTAGIRRDVRNVLGQSPADCPDN